MSDIHGGLVNAGEVAGLCHWPVLVKYVDYEELGYIESAASWEVELGAGGAYLNVNDVLIDSSGVAFTVVSQGDQKSLNRSQGAVNLEQVLTWVRAHASMQGHCCVAKLNASSIAEVFTILKSLDD